MGSLIGESCRKELLNVSIKELENILEVIDKLDEHYSLNVLGCFFQWLFLPIACWLGCFFQSPAGFSQFFQPFLIFECSREYLRTRMFPWQKVYRTNRNKFSTMQKILLIGSFFCVFFHSLFEQTKRSDRKQTAAMRSMINKKN